MRVRATVAYDGTDYQGFQRQANGPTVQEALESAAAQVAQASVTILAAGRTDAGVHAEGQVIAFDTTWRHSVEELQRALNAALPADVAVREVEQATDDFHPRYDARSRSYRYTIYNRPVRSPLHRRTSLHVRRQLDIDAMCEAAGVLVGEHDFATFGQPPVGENTVRQVFRSEWRRDDDLLKFQIEANAFLYKMVRSIVGSLCQVGRGAWSVERFAHIVAAADRSLAGPTAPPQGLCLLAVSY